MDFSWKDPPPMEVSCSFLNPALPSPLCILRNALVERADVIAVCRQDGGEQRVLAMLGHDLAEQFHPERQCSRCVGIEHVGLLHALDDIEQLVMIVGMKSQRSMQFGTGMLAAQISKRDAILMGVYGFTSIWPEVERCRAHPGMERRFTSWCRPECLWFARPSASLLSCRFRPACRVRNTAFLPARCKDEQPSYK
ncbi:hypothetical protein [Noviherbaspirillum malthae]|uniref:hypothetical protein n=1 Tax=Noviherbaspirillum malthae TaxID=1260987 RepID=UPI003F698E58